MLELIAGVLVAFAAVALVLQPLLSTTGGRSKGSGTEAVEFEDLEESASPKVQALLALKEIEFDRATAKLSEDDYLELKAKYAKAALGAIRLEESGAAAEQGGSAAEDAAEALVRKVAEGKLAICPNCGPRPEADAVFCSDCGRALGRGVGTTG